MIYGNDTLEVFGSFGYAQGNTLDMVVFAGQTENRTISVNGEAAQNVDFDSEAQTLTAYGLGLTFAEMSITLENAAGDDGEEGTVTTQAEPSATASSSESGAITSAASSISASVSSAAESAVSSVSDIISSGSAVAAVSASA
jgi:hypothetical protein